jgi:hypothetical protein
VNNILFPTRCECIRNLTRRKNGEFEIAEPFIIAVTFLLTIPET